MVRLLCVQEFERSDVSVRQVADGRRVLPDVERIIDAAWRDTLARPGVRLFDGPIVRFEEAAVAGDHLTITLSRTSYRVLVGTNFVNPHLADLYGPEVMANSMGVSTGLLSGDGHWVMGRRNASVAYYPGRIHPFAGSIEVADDIDLFANAERELREELGLSPENVTRTRLVGLVEDAKLRHPEAIFVARTPLTTQDVAAGLDAGEHHAVWSVAAEPQAMARAFDNDELTPVARAVLLLGGRHLFGEDWFARQQAAAGVRSTL